MVGVLQCLSSVTKRSFFYYAERANPGIIAVPRIYDKYSASYLSVDLDFLEDYIKQFKENANGYASSK